MNIQNNLANAAGTVSNYASSTMNSLRDTVSNVSGTISSATSSMATPFTQSQSSANGFFSANSVVAKFVFLITVLIVFTVLVNLGVSAVGYLMSKSASPYLVKGMISGTQGIVVSQNPQDQSSELILRSSDQPTGLEFTWSIWLLIDPSNYKNSTLNVAKHIFNKGTPNYNADGFAAVSNGPGLYLTDFFVNNTVQTTGTITVKIDTVDGDTKTETVPNIPFSKWFHITIRAQNNAVDIYVNGTISKRINMTAVIMQNYYNVNVCQNNGFLGKLSNLRYFNRALSAYDINSIVSVGPSLVAASDTADARASAYYLADSWF
jgi:hypothetical protein